MSKKHQIFISSTFSDLKAERQAAVEAILAAGHIPAGMELFAAGDESQMEVIKRWIDDSDIYMLILGGRYGSIDPSSNLSYTEIEYSYALEKGKPFFSLVLNEKAIDSKADELKGQHREEKFPDKYSSFRERVLSKISKLVEDCKDIKIGVLESIRHLEGKYPLHGWVRSNELPDVAPLISQLSTLTDENTLLKKKIENAPITSLDNGDIQLANLDDETTVNLEYKRKHSGHYYSYEYSAKLTWGRLFGLVAPVLLSGKNDSYMKKYICEQILTEESVSYDLCSLNEQDFQTIKIHLMALNLVNTHYSKTTDGGAALFWNLTPAGKNTLLKLRAAKKPV